MIKKNTTEIDKHQITFLILTDKLLTWIEIRSLQLLNNLSVKKYKFQNKVFFIEKCTCAICPKSTSKTCD